MGTLFRVALIIEAIFGLGFLVVPAGMLNPFGVTLSDIATTFARMLGSALISLAILLWFALKSDQPEFKRGVVYSLFAYYLVSSVLLVITQLASLMNALGWGVAGIHIILTVWFGYFIANK